ncbi:MAG: filamentous hemagglutinin N-terminal domain-containing protein [Cyanobium sp.]
MGGLQVLALPTGEQTERGNPVRVDRSDANKLTVQTQGRTVISWKDFNIESGKSVEFQNDKTVLNYVRRGGGASRIDGNLRATNPIILLNNQGITVGSTALISVPSILLSTGSLLPDSFDKFVQGANYGNGLNAPLISI